MFRKYVILTLATVLFMGTQACTSHKAEDDSADVESSSTDGLEAADATENNSDLDMGAETSTASNDGMSGGGGDLGSELGGDELAADEKLPDDSGGGLESTEVAAGDISETPPADAGAPPPDMTAQNDPVATPDVGAAPADGAPTMDTASDMPSDAPADTAMAAATPEPSFQDSDPAPVVGSLKKVKSTPWREGKTLLNAVYVARSGDSVKDISQKVFGSPDHVKDICKHNSYNCSRTVKVGDKFYYNSPQRPTDDQSMKTFYEDAGVQPQIYTAKAGDDIKKVGQELLGDKRSWMELWALNDVESKSKLDEGTQLKYWPATEAAAPAQTIASNEGEQPADAAAPGAPMDQPSGPAGDAMAPPPQDMNAGAPPPQDMAANTPPPPPTDSLPPPPDQSMGAAAGAVEPPPPPPPPPPTDAGAAHGDMAAASMEDPNQQTMALAVGAVLLLAAVALFISIRKRKARRAIDFNTSTQTQID